jgi:hypothetical protein
MNEAYTRNRGEAEALQLFRAISPDRQAAALDIVQRAVSGEDITPLLLKWFEGSGFTPEEAAERVERARVQFPLEAAQ